MNGTSNSSSLVGEAKRDPITSAGVILGQNPWRVQRDILTRYLRNSKGSRYQLYIKGKELPGIRP
jgi:hypothetical protein